MNSAELIRLLEKAGWVFRGAKGSHHVYVHPKIPGHISVPRPRKDLGPGLTHKTA
jgi:predicted RNA binding protein YcfA (HicA-like mRNA interferase family)